MRTNLVSRALLGAALFVLPLAAQTYNVTTFSYPSADFTFGYGINSSGYVVGEYSPAGPTSSGFVRNPSGAITSIPVPAGAKSITVYAISDNGLIAGSLTSSSGTPFGFYIR